MEILLQMRAVRSMRTPLRIPLLI
ncbi:hypothetical protein E2C01_057695 [Portunus trituberculatus]|uniref:Uncharacterized protein n=1 Tax=Portunus trituberculatus TaxID=210409 RepID=A0A5B7H167_PORTR|nr:hypothetical protein [Portunus trituberculatus]